MSDDFPWKEYRQIKASESQEKRQNNKTNSTQILKEYDIKFESKNNGVHLIVEGQFDFWPSTGKWIARKGKKDGRGVYNLIKHIKTIGLYNE